jgi:predicted MFS family arabinose efflux permease
VPNVSSHSSFANSLKPTIIKELGFTAANAQLMTVCPYSVATILTITFAMASERLNHRTSFILFSSSVGIIGYIILLSDPSPWPSYVGTIFAASGIYPSCALVLAWPANNVSGQTKRAVASAMQISIGNIGAVIGTQVYRTENAPRFFVGHGLACAYLVGNLVVVSITWAVLKRENARKDGLQEERDGKEEGEGDEDAKWNFQT